MRSKDQSPLHPRQRESEPRGRKKLMREKDTEKTLERERLRGGAGGGEIGGGTVAIGVEERDGLRE